jgi:ATP synthase protein I
MVDTAPSTPAPLLRAPAAGRDGERSPNASLWRGLDHAHMMQVELIAAMLIWGGAGWTLDRWLGSGPWLTIIGSLVGYAAGFYLIWLRSQRMDAEDAADVEAAAASARRQGAAEGGLRGV